MRRARRRKQPRRSLLARLCGAERIWSLPWCAGLPGPDALAKYAATMGVFTFPGADAVDPDASRTVSQGHGFRQRDDTGVFSEESVAASMKAVSDRLGRLDILVNCAAIQIMGTCSRPRARVGNVFIRST